MKLFLDSSAFAKRFIEERGSEEVEQLCSQATELGLSVLCVPEVVSALSRRLRERSLTRQDYAQAKQRLSQDVRDAVIINLTPDVVQASLVLLETHSLRAMDALQIACALAWDVDLFASSDHQQLAVARAVGLSIKQL